MSEQQKIDLLAVGDIATNTFIRLKDASINCDLRREHFKLCVNFGEKVPFEFTEEIYAAGNSPNAVVSASRLGLKTALVSNTGDDDRGRECLNVLKKENVSTKFVSIQQGKNTNHHFVLWYEDERTILVKHEDYDYRLPSISTPYWIYLSSVGAGTDKYHDEIASYLQNNPDIKLAFQPGTFQIKSPFEKMSPFYKRSEIFAVNSEEARRILKTETEETDIKELMLKIHELGPKIVIITDGKNGAYMFDGNNSWHIPIYPDPKLPYERTGAGDALTSTFVSAIILGKTPMEALRWGLVNARAVVQEIGAQRGLLTREALEKSLESAPTGFSAQKI